MDAGSALVLRLFISSPGDVGVERDRAADVLKRLQDEFVHYAELRPYFWEDEPALATASFQDQIPPPSQMDIVVGILWARIGTRLPPDRKKPDGSPYASGTEYELEDAARGYRERRSPDLVVYRKTSPPPIPLDDGAERRRRLEQLDALEDLIRRWFFHEDGSFRAAFNTFKTADEFERLLEAHLRVLIRQKIEKAERPEGRAGGEVVFHGSPYCGLQAFDRKDAAVFYGRGRALSEVKEALAFQESRGCAFLLIFGMSGSGKSSLVRAGLLHGLSETPGFIRGVALWRLCVIRPADAGAGPLDGLAQALFGDDALPELRATGLDAARLARTLRDNPKDIDLALRPALRAAAASLKERKQADRPTEARLVVFVDQMEEVFTRESIDDGRRAEFVAALSALAHSGLAWVVAAMRSDFYPRCAELPELVRLKAGRGQYDLLKPTFAEIGQMIRYPARDAGLRWGKHPSEPGRSLDDVLQEAAWRDPKALPLLQFTLNELFLRRAGGRALTFAAYDDLGGLEGALARRAEGELDRLDPAARAALPPLLRALVTVGQGDDDPLVARRVPLAPLRADPVRNALLDVLIAARLLVTDRADDGQPVVGVAHEALLTAWPRLKDLLDKDREFLRARARVAAAAARWRKEGRQPDDLLPEGKPLAEARDLLTRRPEDIDAEGVEFITTSARFRTRLRRRRARVVASLVGTFCLVVTTFAAISYVEWRTAERRKLEAEKQTLLAVRQKDLALEAINTLTYDLPERFKNVPGTIPVVTSILEENVGMLDRILELEPDTRKAEREKASVYSRIGDRWLLLGDTRRATHAYGKGLTIARGLAKDEGNAQAQRDLAVCYVKFGALAQQTGRLDLAGVAFAKGLAIRLKLAKVEGDAEAQRDLSIIHEHLGDLALQKGDLAGARDAYAKDLAIALRLAKDEGNAVARRDLSVSYHKLGKVLVESGDLAGARVAYAKGLAIRLKLARDEGNAQAQRDLSSSYDRIAEVARIKGDLAGAGVAYAKGLDIRSKLARDEGNTEAQRDLSLSYENLGEVARLKGDLPGAGVAFAKALAIRLKLDRDEGNAQAQRDLSSSYDRIAEVARIKGDLAGARDGYGKALAIAQRLAKDEGNAQAQRDLSIGYERFGEILLASGDLAGARDAYAKDLAIAQRLAKDESNAVAQRDLSISYERFGAVLQASNVLDGASEVYQKCLAIRLKLARDEGNAQAQRDLAITYERLGGLARQKGDLTAARDANRKSLAIALRLAGDEGNAQAQRGLSVSYSELGDIERQKGDLTAARDAYAKGLTIMLRLAKDEGNAQAQRDLAVTYNKLGEILLTSGDLAGARDAYGKGLAIAQRLARDEGDAQAQRALAFSHDRLGSIRSLQKDPEGAREEFSKGLAICERLIRDQRRDLVTVALFGRFCLSLGGLDVGQGESTRAIDFFSRAIQALEASPMPAEPKTLSRTILSNAYAARAQALASAGRNADAIKDWARAIEFDDGTMRDLYRMYHAAALARSGDHARAIAQADELAEQLPNNGAALLNVAGIVSLASAAVAKDSKRSKEERDRLADQYAARAVDLLIKARVVGAFKDPAGIDLLKKEEGFHPLRGRGDFQKLVAELDAKTPAN